jgi:hypothetical protein
MNRVLSRQGTNSDSALIKISHLNDLLIGEFGIPVRFTTQRLFSQFRKSVSRIFGRRCPLKIRISVVNSVAIKMVYFCLSRQRRLKKCLRDQPVNQVVAPFSFAVQRDANVSVPYWILMEYRSLFLSKRVVASDPSEVRDGISDFVILNWLPDFDGAIRLVGHKLRFSKFCSSLRERINAFGGQLLYFVLAPLKSEIA